MGDGKSYYYKVQAQKLAMDGTINGKSTDALSEKVAQDTQEEYEKRLGSKDYRDSMEISTPNGTGSVEKSQGNLMYESTDFSIPSLLLNLELTRTYNSQIKKECLEKDGMTVFIRNYTSWEMILYFRTVTEPI